ncbi:MAG: type II toxin-antitoxin system VapC family toxin [Acidobacteriota bacterium]|nr:type II toxin-antitoxin system VapC family toxin [Acidobacteriota bacterium]
MILLDTSVFLAILKNESDGALFVGTIADQICSVPASVIVEAGILALTRGLLNDLVILLEDVNPRVIPMTEAISFEAVACFARYGKGRHRADLNFGDCLVYATAKIEKLPLLFKGDDFGHTDIRRAT